MSLCFTQSYYLAYIEADSCGRSPCCACDQFFTDVCRNYSECLKGLRGPSVGQTIGASGQFPKQLFIAAINGGVFWSSFDPAVWDGGYLWYNVLYIAYSFVYMAECDLEISCKFIFQKNWHLKICYPFNPYSAGIIYSRRIRTTKVDPHGVRV